MSSDNTYIVAFLQIKLRKTHLYLQYFIQIIKYLSLFLGQPKQYLIIASISRKAFVVQT